MLKRFGRVDILINNAANNPKVEVNSIRHGKIAARAFPSLEQWQADLAVGLTGGVSCAARSSAAEMARRKGGVIVNISHPILALISPDQRLYRKKGLPEGQQPVKPVTYSVVK